MKRLCCLLLIGALLCFNATAQAASLPSAITFPYLFEVAASLTGSGHKITTDNLKVTDGSYKTTYSINLSDSLLINVVVINSTQATDEIVVLASGGGANDSIDFLYAISEVLYCTGAINKIKDCGSVLEKLKMFDNLQDGDSNSIIINDIEYGYLISYNFGAITFYATLPK